ncbi:MAG TPA: TetR/AcrR family transcriptional regulator [Chitinophaga sp.]|uniref:TetR/AcrR family transcriptional regulator n=1 Tax=Chitinophaga sp. TaxID=1869181 RepID=UPI002C295D48|nr:TetR/AcrR family transcriptional regulator [Chitinophaga sp.]HVI44206.1 TetR/AcrR family transcriptional regulator [Chitinophaga sp.]
MAEKIKVRDRILNVATDLFYRQGYNQTGINQIIAEADIAIGSLYNHFPSKGDLLVAYLEKQEEEWFAAFEHFSKGANTPREKIFRFIDFRIEQQQVSAFCGCPFIKIVAELGQDDDKIHKLVEAHKDKQRVMLQSWFKQLDYEGIDKKLLADNLFLMVEGATISTTISRNTQALESVKKFLRKLL